MKNRELIDFILLDENYGNSSLNNISQDLPEEVKKAEELIFKYYENLKGELKENRKTKTFEAYDLENEIIKRTMEYENIRQSQAIRHLIRIGYMELTGYDRTESFMRIERLKREFLKKV
ncbi:MAG: hypothetical protein KAH04_07730 [Psychrilyobacter sp.]|nr:hypothetical protein [Psychrilyobacter sp.]